METHVRQELRRLCDVWEAAEKAVREARAAGESDARAQLARSEALADWHAASASLGDLFRLLLRHALKHHADALRQALVGLLRPELEPFLETVIRLKKGGRPA
jgi:predicted Zn-dependent protease with MMP-like domain